MDGPNLEARMSIRQAMLAILEQGPMYGYQLRAEFEQRTGETWPLNIGQVYTTLTRLERDGLVEVVVDEVVREVAGHGGVGEPLASDRAHVSYRATEAGRGEVSQWFATPVPRTQPPRDELAIKLAIAVTLPGVDVGAIIQRQRSATMTSLQDYTRLKRSGRAATPQDSADLAWSLVLDSLVFDAEAEVRWLDHCEARLRRAAAESARTAPGGVTPVNAVLHLAAVSRVHGEGATEVHALRSVTFRAHPGELVAVMGPSGSGKSTLLTLAGGLDTPTSGSIWIEGTDLASLDNAGRARIRRTSVGYVFQDFNLIPALTAAENVALPRELDGEKARVARRLALTALEEVGIADLADRFPDEMSGGQQQRVAIARAIVGDRRLILADEPTGALDTDTGEEILRLLRARCDAGAAGVMVTHEARHAAWADRVVFLRDGVIVDETGADEPEQLLAGDPA